jgi:hypothetical protein
MEKSTKTILAVAGIGAAGYLLLRKKAPKAEKASTEIKLADLDPTNPTGPTELVQTCLGTSPMGSTMGVVLLPLVIAGSAAATMLAGLPVLQALSNRADAISAARRDSAMQAKELEKIPEAVGRSCRRDPIRVISPPTQYIRSIVEGPVVQFTSPIFVEKPSGKFEGHISHTQVILPADVVGTSGVTIARKVTLDGRPVVGGDPGIIMYKVARTGYFVPAHSFIPVENNSSQGKVLPALTEAPFDLRFAGAEVEGRQYPAYVYAAPTYSSDKIGQYYGLVWAPYRYPNAVMGEYVHNYRAKEPGISCSWYPVEITDKTGLTKKRIGFISNRETRQYTTDEVDRDGTYNRLLDRYGIEKMTGGC